MSYVHSNILMPRPGSLNPPPTGAPDFPRIGAIILNGDQVSATAKAAMAFRDLVCMYEWEDLHNFYGFSLASVQAAIKAINANVVLGIYTNPQAIAVDGSDAISRPVWLAKIQGTTGYQLFLNGSSGTAVVASYNPGQRLVNVTAGAGSDGTYICPEWIYGVYGPGTFMNGENGVAANPYCDFIMFDNFTMQMDGDGDYDRNGTTDTKTTAASGLIARQGLAAGTAKFRVRYPTKLIGGNVANIRGLRLGNYAGTSFPDPTTNGILDMHFSEYCIGEGWSIETWGTTAQFIQGVFDEEDACGPLKLNMFNCKKLVGLGGSTNQQDFRHAFAAYCCISNGYFAYEDTNSSDDHGTTDGTDRALKYFAEYDKTGTNRRYIATWSDLRQSSPWLQGVYRRQSTSGVWALWNPRGNGSQTVALGTTKHKLDGSAVTSVTLADRDGLILV